MVKAFNDNGKHFAFLYPATYWGDAKYAVFTMPIVDFSFALYHFVVTPTTSGIDISDIKLSCYHWGFSFSYPCKNITGPTKELYYLVDGETLKLFIECNTSWGSVKLLGAYYFKYSASYPEDKLKNFNITVSGTDTLPSGYVRI